MLWMLLAGLPALPSSSAAQTTPDLLRPRLAADPTRNYVVTPAAEVNDELAFSAGLAVGYAHRPLQLVDGDGNALGDLVRRQVYGSLNASLVAARRLQIALDLPVALSQAAGTLAPVGGLQATALGDLRTQAVVSLWSSRQRLDEPGVALAVVGEVLLPTGSGANFTGGALRGGGGLVLEAFAHDRLRFALSGVYRAGPTIQVASSRLNDVVQWSLASEYRMGDAWSLAGDLVGEVGTGGDGEPARQRPMELLAAGRWHRGMVYTQAGAGLGLTQGVGTPVYRVFAGVGVTPRGRRWEGQPADPLPVVEEAPAPVVVVEVEPEPPAPPECTADDTAGCPPAPAPMCEAGALVRSMAACEEGTCVVRRIREACPLDHICQPTADGAAACVPEEVHEPTAVVDDTLQQIVINETILFRFDSADIDPRSDRILDRVAEVLLRETSIQRVRVEGHTDFIGDARYNQVLSERRAAAVVEALVRRGVERSRLRSAGFGFTRPVDPARTDEARARNRRVEFHMEVQP
jgi:outer membrane protein OmpA-like peptidoglycan-associated protein